MTSDRQPVSSVGRFAPSPSGPLHLGSLLAAMASYLQARHHGGKWLLRMEDLDPPREVAGAADEILSGLETHGFAWDEEVVYQSACEGRYLAALDLLREQDRIFACACSRKQIAAAHTSEAVESVYPGTCRVKGLAFVPDRSIRIRVNRGEICFDDCLQGRICENVADKVGDFIVRRRNGLHAYQLAVVCDDAAQGVTEVVRGCDLLSSTPRQIQLQQALGLPEPSYLHVPLILGPDGKKLSKQTGATPLDSRDALASLQSVHQLLRQRPAPDGVGSVAEFWEWAIPNWDLRPLRGLRSVSKM